MARRSWLLGSMSVVLLTVGCGGGDGGNGEDGSGGASAGGSAGAGGSSGAGGSAGGAGGASGGAGGSSGGSGGAGGAGGASGGSGGASGGAGGAGGSGGGTVTPPPAACEPTTGGGSTTVAAPELLWTGVDRWEEGWLGSPAVADLDRDGSNEVVTPRANALVVWTATGDVRFKLNLDRGRIWASPVVADFRGDAHLEIVFAMRDEIHMVDDQGNELSGFPVVWEDELRSIAAGDVNGDGALEIVVAPAHGGPTDVMHAFSADGMPLAGFPPNGAGTSGCDDRCYLAGCFDQNLAIGDLDGDGTHDIVAPHDNAYASFHHGSGEAFDAESGFNALKTPGVRYLHDLAEAQQGWAPNEDTALQAHFTNTAPAIADLDDDGTPEILMLASVQNAAQTDREQGVALWVVQSDASRHPGWETPFHAPDFLSGLWDYGNNIVAITNQVTVADIDPNEAGPELLFAGFDGRIHAVSSAKQSLWSATYTTDPGVATGGVVVADLSGDGSPEIVFTTYSTADGASHLFVLDAGGNELHRVPLPTRGAMPVPTLADVDGNGTLEIVVSLKDAEDRVEMVRVYTVSSSSTNCMLWPTGRGNLLRNGWVR